MLKTDTATDEEIRFEIVSKGLPEFINEKDMNIILETYGLKPVRARDFTGNGTEEKRIATAIDRIE